MKVFYLLCQCSKLQNFFLKPFSVLQRKGLLSVSLTPITIPIFWCLCILLPPQQIIMKHFSFHTFSLASFSFLISTASGFFNIHSCSDIFKSLLELWRIYLPTINTFHLVSNKGYTSTTQNLWGINMVYIKSRVQHSMLYSTHNTLCIHSLQSFSCRFLSYSGYSPSADDFNGISSVLFCLKNCSNFFYPFFTSFHCGVYLPSLEFQGIYGFLHQPHW